MTDNKNIFKQTGPYSRNFIDADTILYEACACQQNNYIVVTHKPTGNERPFNNRTAFYGHWKKKEGGWLGATNKERVEAGKEPFKLDDFDIEDLSEVTGSVEEGLDMIDFKIGEIRKHTDVSAYTLIIGGEGNFRNDLGKILKYKGERPPKPLLFSEIREELIYKYRNKVIVVDGIEADDVISMKGWENYRHFCKTGKYKWLLSYVDKDICQVPGPWFNYGKPDNGITIISPEHAADCFATQLLMGDKSTDNIPGLPKLPDHMFEKYKIRKYNGVGKTTVEELFKDKTTKEKFEIVVEAYRGHYGDEPFEFEAWDGEKSERTWLDMLQENAVLLYLMRKPSEQHKHYKITRTLDLLGVEYGEH